MTFVLNEYLNELRPLIDVDCGSLHKPGLKVAGDIFAEKYRDMGWQVEIIDLGVAGCGVQARNKPEAEHIDLMLVGHLDTVFPEGTVAKRPMRCDETKLYGPGTADMKAGLLSFVYALRGMDSEVLNELSICVCMNPDEEIGSAYSVDWIKQLAAKSKVALVGEAARKDGSMVKARKGIARYNIEFEGKAVHAGNEPENGRSAISELARWIVATDEMTDFETGTTFNTGIVHGGIGANVVADHARGELDIRFRYTEEFEKAERALKAMAEKPFIDGVTVKLEKVAFFPAMTPIAATEPYMALVEEAGREIDVEVKWLAVGGASDANHISYAGVPALDGFAPIGGGHHSTDEFVMLDSIEPRIRLLQRVITKLAEQ